MLYHLLNQRHHAKHFLLKFQYLLDNNADCTDPRLLQEVAMNDYKTSKHNQMLTNYILALLANHKAPVHFTFSEDGKILIPGLQFNAHYKPKPETFWLLSVLFKPTQLFDMEYASQFPTLHYAVANTTDASADATIKNTSKTALNRKNQFGHTA